MRYLKLLLLLLIGETYSQEIIECQKDYCSVPSSVQLVRSSEYLNFSSFEIISTEEDIEVNTTSYSRNFKSLLNSYSDKGVNLSINSTSNRDDKTGSNFIFFADSISNLNISNNGFSGSIKPSSSFICASNILSGKYGYIVRNKFEERRENDPTLSIDICDDTDLQIIRTNSQHTCEENYQKIPDTNIKAQRHKIYKRCIGDAARKLCVAKKLELACLWKGDKIIGDSNCCSNSSLPKVGAENWSCDENLCDSTNSGWYRELKKVVTKDYYENQISKDPVHMCQKEFPRPYVNYNTSNSINRDYGYPKAYYATRDFSHDLPNPSQRSYYRVEVKTIETCNTSWKYQDQCYQPPSSDFIYSSGFISMGRRSSIKCSILNGRVNCIYRNSLYNVDNRLPTWMRVKYQTKAYFIDPSGFNNFHLTDVTIIQKGYWGTYNDDYEIEVDDDFWAGGQ